MKKFCYLFSLLILLMLIPSTGWGACLSPSQFTIGGTVTVDGVQITADADAGYEFIVVKSDGTEFTNVDTIPIDDDGLREDNNWYIVTIPIDNDNADPDLLCNGGGAHTGDTVIIEAYYNDTKLTVTSPENAEVTVGDVNDNLRVDLVLEGPKTLTIESSENGSTTPAAGSTDYDHGEEVAISATAASGYTFAGWTGDTTNIADISASSTTITMNADATIAASYVVCNKTLTMAVNDAQMGSVTPDVGESTRACELVVDITATPASGYFFVNWSGDVADANSATTTVTMDADKTVTANFAAITYTLTVTAPTNGSIDLDPETTGNVYAEDQVVTVTAVPSTGYLFDAWTGDVADSTAAETTVTMDADKTIGATFVECTKTLTMGVNDTQMGSTTPATGDNTQSCDATVTITATPEDGYTFVNWTGDVADANSATTTVTMDTDKTVTANFVVTTYILTIGAANNGSVTLSPAADGNEYAEGAVVTLTATADTDYAFAGWTGDVANVRLATTTVTMDTDKTVTPSFLGDADADGKDDTEEQGPEGTDADYDGNDDGTADSTQANVVSTHNADASMYVTLATDASNTLDAEPIENPDDSAETPSGVTLDYGYYDITLTGLAAGGATTVTIILPEDADTPDTYYKFGPTADNTTPHWYEFLYDSTTETGAEFDGNVITLHFVDGLRGDGDLDATNGVIDDPGAPGRVDAIPAVGTDDDNCFITTASSGSQNVKLYVAAAVAGFFFLMVFGFARYRRK